MVHSSLVSSLFLLAAAATSTALTLPDPLFATYWGQSTEQSLSSYCALGYFNVISIGFVSGFGATDFAFATDGCTATATSGSCSSLGAEIQKCQAAGVKILISYGGATKFDCGSDGCTGDYYFATEAQATAAATQAWEMFFNSGTVTSGVARPFGKGVVLDGIDLDIEMTATGDGQDPQLHYDTFANALKSLDSNIIVSGSPECQYGSLGSNPLAGAVTTASLDFLFVQFFNNAKCNVASSNFAAAFAFWASQAAANPNGATRVLLGLPGTASAALSTANYYLTPAEALGNVSALRAAYPNAHVGVGVWDAAASQTGNWAKSVAAGLTNLPAVSSVASGTVALSTGSVVGNATSAKGKTSSGSAVKTGSTTSGSVTTGTGASQQAAVSASATAASPASMIDVSPSMLVATLLAVVIVGAF
ncbi:glycoside hydrolase [Meredithblackwellia eburnea MCA 4105]